MIHHTYVHLSIDVQSQFYCKLSPERKVSFPKAEKAFAEAMRELSIPTIWVAFGDLEDFILYEPASQKRDIKIRENEIQRLGLEKVSPPMSDALYVKGDRSAFSDHREKELLKYVKDLCAKKLIVTGMNTCGCVEDTLFEAKLKNFEVFAVYDQMACISDPAAETSPSWHKKLLKEERVRDDELFTKDELITKLMRELTPHRATSKLKSRALAQLQAA